MARPTNGFNRMPPPSLLGKGRSIVSKVKNNSFFPNPVPNMSDLTTLLDSFEGTITDAATRDLVKIALRDKKKEEVVASLHQLSNYVLFASGGDREKILSSGFDANKIRTSKPAVVAPVDMQVLAGKNPGELDVLFTSVPGAKSYLYQYTTDDPLGENVAWQSVAATVSKLTLTGLKSSQRYYVRIAVIGINSQFVYSDAVTRVTQ